MTAVVTMGSVEEINALKEKFCYPGNLLFEQGLKINLQLAKNGELAILACDFNANFQYYNSADKYLLFRQYVVNTISELILGYWEGKLIKGIIKEQFYFFTPAEKEKIFSRSLELVQTGLPAKCQSLVYQLNRKAKIINRLSEYLEKNNEINIEGFIKFRLKDYIIELHEVVNYAVDEFMMEKEYKEFISLLRYFVEIQEPRLDKVHVVVQRQGKITLYDTQKKEISNDYLDDFFSDLTDADINYEDMIISALITISPKQVEIHIPYGKEMIGEIINTIKQVFNKRILDCPGCHWCQSLQLL